MSDHFIDVDFDGKDTVVEKTEVIYNNENVTTQSTEIIAKNDNDDTIINSKDSNEDNSPKTLGEVIEQAMASCPFKEFVTLNANETVTYVNSVKSYFVEGRLSKSFKSQMIKFQNEIVDKISQKMGATINVSEFWKVSCGLKVGDKFLPIEVLDAQGKAHTITHEIGTILILDVWTIWYNVDNYFHSLIESMKKIATVDDSIKVIRVGLSGEDFTKWSNLISARDISQHSPQYNSATLYDELDIKETPQVIIVDPNGIVRCFDLNKFIDVEETIKNYKEGKLECVKINQEEKFESNPNNWWIELDRTTQIDIVRNVNVNLRELGIQICNFSVTTNYVYNSEGKENTTVTLPIFSGTLSEFEYEIIQNIAVELQSSWNFSIFQFNCRVMVL